MLMMIESTTLVYIYTVDV